MEIYVFDIETEHNCLGRHNKQPANNLPKLLLVAPSDSPLSNLNEVGVTLPHQIFYENNLLNLVLYCR